MNLYIPQFSNFAIHLSKQHLEHLKIWKEENPDPNCSTFGITGPGKTQLSQASNHKLN